MSSSPTLYPTAETLAGQRRQVWEGRAQKTRGGLTKADLKVSKSGKIVSKAKSSAGRKMYKANGLSILKYTKSGSKRRSRS